MAPLTIAILIGTSREQRESVKVVHYLAEFGARLPDVEIVVVDPRELTLPDDGADIHDPQYKTITARADAFMIVTPEYNHSYPGSLKRMLDSEFDNYWHKPVSLVGVSSGNWGGVRACEALLPVCHTMGLITIKPELYFPRVHDLFDERGLLKTEYSEEYEQKAQKIYNELIWMARLFKGARQDK